MTHSAAASNSQLALAQTTARSRRLRFDTITRSWLATRCTRPTTESSSRNFTLRVTAWTIFRARSSPRARDRITKPKTPTSNAPNRAAVMYSVFGSVPDPGLWCSARNGIDATSPTHRRALSTAAEPTLWTASVSPASALLYPRAVSRRKPRPVPAADPPGSTRVRARVDMPIWFQLGAGSEVRVLYPRRGTSDLICVDESYIAA